MSSSEIRALCEPCEDLLLLALAKRVSQVHDLPPASIGDAISRDIHTISPQNHVKVAYCRLCHSIAKDLTPATPIVVGLGTEISLVDGSCQISTHDGEMVMRVCQSSARAGPYLLFLTGDFEGSSLTPLELVHQLIAPREIQHSQVLTMKNWLNTCNREHENSCSLLEHPTLPSRVLRIDQNANQIQLVSGSGQRGAYAALSYCWGGHNPVTTTTKTLQAHERGISISDLPLLFQQTIEVALILGLNYLWIDALCIVQDDLQEWQREASQMADVFSNTYITIVASAAFDPSASLFQRRVFIDFKDPRFPTYDNCHAIALIDYTISDRHVFECPLNKRAWTLQELMLSPRNLHFAINQMYWHCEQLFISNSGGEVFRGVGYSSGLDVGLNTIGQAVTRHKYRLWWRIIEDYSDRSLTLQKDKLVALQGIAAKFCSFDHDELLSGIWRQDLPRGLIWTRHCCGQPRHAVLDSHIPSWSWAFSNCAIWFSNSLSRDGWEGELCVEMLHGSQTLLRLKGVLWPVTSRYQNVGLRLRVDTRDTAAHQCTGGAEFDRCQSEQEPGLILFVLPVVACSVGRYWVEGLVVTPVKTETDRFRRVGHFGSNRFWEPQLASDQNPPVGNGERLYSAATIAYRESAMRIIELV